MNKVIKFLTMILPFTLSIFFFAPGNMVLLSKRVLRSEINNKYTGVGHINMSFYITLKEAEDATLSCAEKILEYESDHTVLIDSFPHPNLKFDEKDSLIISDHKTHCEYITLFGKQIGKIPIT